MSSFKVKPRYCGDFRIYQHYRFNISNSTGNGLVDLLIRHGIVPTMNSEKDILLAKQFMPRSCLECQLVGYVKRKNCAILATHKQDNKK